MLCQLNLQELSVLLFLHVWSNFQRPFKIIFQQTAEVNPQYFTKSADLLPHFQVEGHTFEVGGKSKKQKQVKDINDAFIVKDDIENSYLNILPLWTFGMNY